MHKKKLIQGTVILTAASLLNRILGLANHMVLSRLIGAEGLGLFQMAFPYYSLMMVVASLSLPGAISRIVSQRQANGDFRGVEQVRHLAIYLVTCTSIISSLTLWFGAPILAQKFLPDPRVELLFKAMAPALLFMGLSSVHKGYFNGLNNMVPPAVSISAEQIVRVSCGLLAAYLLLPWGLTAAAVGSVLGISLGELSGLAVIRWYDKHRERPKGKTNAFTSNIDTLREIFYFASPLIMVRFITSLSNTIEAYLIPNRLIGAGFSAAQATSLFGELTGMALPLLFLPTVAIMPLSITLVPTITSAAAVHDHRLTNKLVTFAFWITLLAGGLTAIVLYLFPVQLTSLFYDAPAVAPLVAGLAPAAPFAYLQFTGAAILNGIGLPRNAFYTEIITSCILLSLIYILVGIPQFGIQGAVWAIDIAFSVGAAVSLLFIYRGIKNLMLNQSQKS